MDMTLLRQPSQGGTTLGELQIDGEFECYTLEDEIRDVDGELAADQKIYGETAIPARRYRITLENSPRFGPDTLTVNNVPGFTGVRMHAGTTKEDTLGCVILGDHVDAGAMTISGGRNHGVVERVKSRVRNAIACGEMVWMTIKNPEATE